MKRKTRRPRSSLVIWYFDSRVQINGRTHDPTIASAYRIARYLDTHAYFNRLAPTANIYHTDR